MPFSNFLQREVSPDHIMVFEQWRIVVYRTRYRHASRRTCYAQLSLGKLLIKSSMNFTCSCYRTHTTATMNDEKLVFCRWLAVTIGYCSFAAYRSIWRRPIHDITYKNRSNNSLYKNFVSVYTSCRLRFMSSVSSRCRRARCRWNFMNLA